MPNAGERGGGKDGAEEGRRGGGKTRDLVNWGSGPQGHWARPGSHASQAAAMVMSALRAQAAPAHSPAPEDASGRPVVWAPVWAQEQLGCSGLS